jgi:hypothetical protein
MSEDKLSEELSNRLKSVVKTILLENDRVLRCMEEIRRKGFEPTIQSMEAIITLYEKNRRCTALVRYNPGHLQSHRFNHQSDVIFLRALRITWKEKKTE